MLKKLFPLFIASMLMAGCSVTIGSVNLAQGENDSKAESHIEEPIDVAPDTQANVQSAGSSQNDQ
jgi:hypothetical protein